MSIYANIEDQIKINNIGCTVIGINIMMYKENNNHYVVCEYKLMKNSDKSILYIEDNLQNNTCYIYNKTDTEHKLHNYTKVKTQYYFIDAIGDTDFNKYNKIIYKYYLKDNILVLEKGDYRIYHGLKITSEYIKVNRNIYSEPFSLSLPDINKFHDDNKIKNEISHKATEISVGEGLLINDEEYFVLSKSEVYNDIVKTNEYKLFNNNNKKYYWIKYINRKHILFHEAEDIKTFNSHIELVKEQLQPNKRSKEYKIGTKQRVSIFSDWATINNSQCDYTLHCDQMIYYLKEEWQFETNKLVGNEIKLANIYTINYNYKIKQHWENVKLVNATKEKKEHKILNLLSKYHEEIINLLLLGVWFILLMVSFKISIILGIAFLFIFPISVIFLDEFLVEFISYIYKKSNFSLKLINKLETKNKKIETLIKEDLKIWETY
ncbi:MAG: hypothetical protein MJ211_11325 [Bacteroidales bacterium]|nr:hypothetical protein [Bacteroidales bacterium]